MAARAEELAIQSFDGTGRLTFNEVSTAETYRVEWAPSPAGPWTNFTAAAMAMDRIVAKGSGIVTCSVPMCYRVVATVTNAVPSQTTISVAAIPGVTAPVIGATPVTTITETAQYTGTVSWSPAHSPFQGGGQVYTATITLTPKAGFTLAGVGANFFTAAGGAPTNSADSGAVTVTYPATALWVVNQLNFGLVWSVPGDGIPMDWSARQGSQYTATPFQCESIDDSATYTTGQALTFERGKNYEILFQLTAKPGYTLTGVGEDALTLSAASYINNPPNAPSVTVGFVPY